MGVKTTVSQGALRGGGRDAQSSGILVDERATRLARGRDRGNLYVVVEVSGPPGDQGALANWLAELVRDVYYSQRGSITAGLQQALRRVNATLLAQNRDSLPGEQRTAGISCAALRREDLFIAQAGPTALLIDRQGGLERYPEVSPWLDGVPREEADSWALGERHEANVALAHTTVGQGETILLTGDALPRLVAAASWHDLLSRQPIEAALEAVLGSSRGADVSALLVRVGDTAAPAPAREHVSPPPTPSISVPSTRRRPAAASPADVTVRQAGAGPDQPATSRRVDTAQPLGSAPPPADDNALERVGQAGQRAASNAGQALRRGGVTLGAGLATLLSRMMPARGAQPTPPARGAAPRGGARAARAGAGAGQSAARAAGTAAPAAKTDTATAVQKALVVVALLIPLVVALVVGVTLASRGRAVRSELDALWNQAQAQWKEAQTTADPDQARLHLTGAEQALGNLLDRDPDYAGAADLRGSVRARLDVINRVQRITWSGALASYPANAKLSRVIVQGVDIFVMDRQNGKVYHHRLDDQLGRTLEPDTRDRVLVARGMQVGGVLVGDMVDMTWMPIGPNRQKASLVILESGGSLLDYDPSTDQLAALRVSSADTWQFPALVGGHSGRFYVLDSNANQIWRYTPTPDGYALPPDEWLQQPVDLAGVIDMSIADSIFLLYADGSILKLTRGVPDPFQLSGWDVPPANPSALFARPPEETQWLYLADRGHGRIVQAGLDGAFKQQFRLGDGQAADNGDALTHATSLFVDEIEGQAFVLSQQQLYLLVLPMSP